MVDLIHAEKALEIALDELEMPLCERIYGQKIIDVGNMEGLKKGLTLEEIVELTKKFYPDPSLTPDYFQDLLRDYGEDQLFIRNSRIKNGFGVWYFLFPETNGSKKAEVGVAFGWDLIGVSGFSFNFYRGSDSIGLFDVTLRESDEARINLYEDLEADASAYILHSNEEDVKNHQKWIEEMKMKRLHGMSCLEGVNVVVDFLKDRVNQKFVL